MKSFIVKITAITLGLVLLAWLVFSMFLPEYYLPIFPFLLLFSYSITLLFHFYQLNLVKKNLSKFTTSTMLLTFLRLVLYSLIGIIYIAIDSENAISFVICLMLLYLIFTFIEVNDASKIAKTPKL